MTKPIIAFLAAAFTAAAATATGAANPGVATESESGTAASDSASRTSEFVPMTRSEHLRRYVTSTFGPAAIARSAALAGIGQLNDSPTEWPQSSEGYAYRFANSFGKTFVRHTLEYGASLALHEDDRYLVSGEKGFWKRAKYAVASGFLARRESGQRVFALARMSSAAGAAIISRAWQPASSSSAGDAAVNFGFTMATDLGSNVIREFWPDLKRCFGKK